MVNSADSAFQNQVTVETIDLAICVNEFYFTNFKLITSSIVKVVDDKTFRDEIFKKAILNGASQTNVIAITKLSKGRVSKIWNKHLDDMEKKLETGNQL